jgi:hypothetical protein
MVDSKLNGSRLTFSSQGFLISTAMRWNILLLFILFGSGPVMAQHPILTYRAGKVMVWPGSENADLKVYRGVFSLTQGLEKIAILGRRSISGDTLFFEPLAPFTMEERYTAIYDDYLIHHFRVPLPEDYARARVEQIYPSADTLPANLLKFHILFSRPMQMGSVYSHIALLTADGDTINRALLPLDPPLWNADRTVLTLWMEPGRIKRDLGPYEKLGPILKAGHSYLLVVDAAMKDENGQALAAPRRQTFYATGRDTLRPDAESWRLSVPAAGSGAPLTVHFGETLDWATLTTYLEVQNASGEVLGGSWLVSNQERQAGFSPARPWKAGRYRIRINPKLEDVAGNNIHRLFDREVGKAPGEKTTTVLELVIPH